MEDVVRCVAAQTEITQNHLHILLDFQKLSLQLRPGLLLKQEPHGGDGGFNLVGPKGVVVRHVLYAVTVLQGQGRPFRGQGPEQGLIILLQQPLGRRQGENLFPDLDQQPLQLPVPPEKLEVSSGEQREAQGKAQHKGVAYRLQGQTVRVKDSGANAQAPPQQHQQLPVPRKIRPQDLHTSLSSTR